MTDKKPSGFLWGGRFAGKPARELREYTFSLPVDRRLALHDVTGSIAHAKMLGATGIIGAAEARKIARGLEKVASEMREGRFVFKADDEDIHTAVERRLVEIVGTAGEKLHTARSRNDQIVLDEKLFLKEELAFLSAALRDLQRALAGAARRVYPVLMPAYTHLQRGQPILASYHLLAYCEMIERDRGRLADCLRRLDVLPLGVGACCGTTLPTDREFLRKELGFAAVSRNGLDTVGDRDFLIETAAVCAVFMVHVSRLAEDLVLWATPEFGYIELPEAFCTGSSMMPQKKNPDVPELARGKAAAVIAALNGLCILAKGLPLSYNRDLQEDKRHLFVALEETFATAKVFAAMLPGVVFIKKRMEEAAGSSFTTTTDLAEYLVTRGVPFRQAHRICGNMVRYCLEKGKDFKDLSLEELKAFAPGFGADVRERLKADVSVRLKQSAGGTSHVHVEKELKRWERLLK